MSHFWHKLKQLLLTTSTIIKTHISPAWLSVILVGLISSWALFILPSHGIANNGDFNKWFDATGIYPLKGFAADGSAYFTREYGILQYYNPTADNWLSSQSLFLAIALFLNKLFYSSVIFDIRFLGALYLVYYLGGIYLLTVGVTGKGRRRSDYLLALLIVFIFGDTSYTLYFQSFYVLGLLLITLVYLFAITIALYRRLYPTKFLFTFFLFNAFLLVTLHQQYLFIILFLLAWLWLVHLTSQSLSTKILALFGTFTVVLGAIITFAFINLGNQHYQQFEAVSQGVLTVGDLEDEPFDSLNSQYSLLKNQDYFDEYLPLDINGNDTFTQLYQPLGSFWLLKHYALHPSKLIALMKSAMPQVFQVQELNLGNFEKEQGHKPGGKYHFFNGYQRLRQAVFPKTFAFYLIFSAVLLALYLPLIFKAFQLKNRRRMLPALLTLSFLLMSYLNFLTALLSYGTVGLTMRLFFIPVVFDLIIVFTLAELFHKNLWQPIDPLVSQKRST